MQSASRPALQAFLPAIARSLFEQEMFIDYGPFGPYDLAELKARVDRWTEGNPQALPPAVTAKWLAFKVAEAYRGDLERAIRLGVLPFLLGDLLKVSIALLIARRYRRKTLAAL